MDYFQIAAVVCCVTFFVRGAWMDRRSPFVWGMLSLGAWIVGSQVVVGGFAGGFLSQVVLYVGLYAWDSIRERREEIRRASER